MLFNVYQTLGGSGNSWYMWFRACNINRAELIDKLSLVWSSNTLPLLSSNHGVNNMWVLLVSSGFFFSRIGPAQYGFWRRVLTLPHLILPHLTLVLLPFINSHYELTSFCIAFIGRDNLGSPNDGYAAIQGDNISPGLVVTTTTVFNTVLVFFSFSFLAFRAPLDQYSIVHGLEPCWSHIHLVTSRTWMNITLSTLSTISNLCISNSSP